MGKLNKFYLTGFILLGVAIGLVILGTFIIAGGRGVGVVFMLLAFPVAAIGSVLIYVGAFREGAFERTKRVIDKAFGITEVRSNNQFNGTWFEVWLKRFLYTLFVMVTFGIGTAWAITWWRRYMWNNTVVDGKQMVYTATGGDYFVKRIVWLLLSIVTFGVYAIFFRPVREEAYLLNHLHFVGEQPQGAVNQFHGGWMDFFLVRTTAYLLMFTIVGLPFGMSMLYNFRYANWQVDGKRFVFHGSWNSIMARTAFWLLLTASTFGLWWVFARHAAHQRWVVENLTTTTEAK